MLRFHELTFADSAAFDLCDLGNAYDSQGRLLERYATLRVARSSRAECDVPFPDEKPFIGARILSVKVKGDSLIVETMFKRNTHVGWRERYAIVANRGASLVSHVMEYRITVLTVM